MTGGDRVEGVSDDGGSDGGFDSIRGWEGSVCMSVMASILRRKGRLTDDDVCGEDFAGCRRDGTGFRVLTDATWYVSWSVREAIVS